MKDLVNKAVALGLGLGVAGKEQAAKLAAAIEKKLGASSKESKAFVAEAVRKGEQTRVELEKQICALAKSVLPVSRREFDALKAHLARKKKK